MLRHWAADYIGKPWAPDGEGPARYSCWGLVRSALRRRGVDLPVLAPRALRRAVRVRTPKDGDVVLMRSRIRTHCGLLVRANGGAGVLHATRDAGVVWQPLDEASAGMRFEFWRPV